MINTVDDKARTMTEKIWELAKNYKPLAKDAKHRIYVSEEEMNRAYEIYMTSSGVYGSIFITGMAAVYSKTPPDVQKLTKANLEKRIQEIYICEGEDITNLFDLEVKK